MGNLTMKGIIEVRCHFVNNFKPTIFFLVLTILIACDPKPKRAPLPNHVELEKKDPSATEDSTSRALWFTTTNYATGGTLGRLDLQTGQLDRNVLTVGSDTLVVSDLPQGIFLLNRMTADSVSALKGERAELSAHYVLDKKSNPQAILRDRLGHVWVTNQSRNEILVLDESMNQQIASVDLRSLALKTETEELAYLAQLFQIESGPIFVTAQRMHRTVRSWKPDALSGIASINPQTFIVDSAQLLPIPNPIQLGKSAGKITMIGAGDLSAKDGLEGAVATLDLNEGSGFSVRDNAPLGGKVLGADTSVESEDPTMIVWYPRENKSCVQVGKTRIVCDGNALNEGYVFNAIHRIGSLIFVAYYGEGEAQLWIITLTQSSFDLKKVAMDLPILSFCGGL